MYARQGQGHSRYSDDAPVRLPPLSNLLDEVDRRDPRAASSRLPPMRAGSSGQYPMGSMASAPPPQPAYPHAVRPTGLTQAAAQPPSAVTATSSHSPYGQRAVGSDQWDMRSPSAEVSGESGDGTPRGKRRQVKRACTACQKACKACADVRPCPRCVSHGMADACVDAPRKAELAAKEDMIRKRGGAPDLYLDTPEPARAGPAYATERSFAGRDPRAPPAAGGAFPPIMLHRTIGSEADPRRSDGGVTLVRHDVDVDSARLRRMPSHGAVAGRQMPYRG